MRPRRPPVQQCNAHGPYRAWRPVCPACVAEQQRLGKQQETVDRLEPRRPVAYGEFPDGF